MHFDHHPRLTLHSAVEAVVLATLVVATLAQADEKISASLELRGSVPTSCTVDIAPTSKASSLDLRAGEQDAVVGVVTENCNSRHGYTVTISSGGTNQLRSAAAGAAAAPYTLRYDGVAAAGSEPLVANRNQAYFGRQGNLQVSIPGSATAVAGDYSANLSLVITAK